MKKINKIIATSVLAISFAGAASALQQPAAHADNVSSLTQQLNSNNQYRGQKLINGHWYYFDDSTGNVVTGFKYIASQNKEVYYDKNGQMLYGQQNINGHWYYFDDITGAEVTGWKYIASQNKEVYYDKNGQMLYGQQYINGHWYYFDDITGAEVKGFKYIASQNKKVYYDKNGQMLYGQQNINGHWYYFDDTTGAEVTGFKYIASQNKEVYYDENGQMLYGQQCINSHWYYFDDNTGAEVTGWKYIASQNKMVYYNSNGWMVYNTQKINNVTYTFDKTSGALEGQDAASLKLSQASFAKKTNQTVVTVANNTTSASVTLYSKDQNGIWTKTLGTEGYVGAQGVGQAHEGTNRTPQGAYSLGFAFGTHATASTSLSYRQIDSRSYWIEDPSDSDYNTWQERTWANSKSEHLIDYPVQYEYAIVINYNTTQRIRGAGSGFFLHIANGHPTAGCVSVPRSVMISLLSRIKPGAYIVNVNSTNQINNY